MKRVLLSLIFFMITLSALGQDVSFPAEHPVKRDTVRMSIVYRDGDFMKCVDGYRVDIKIRDYVEGNTHYFFQEYSEYYSNDGREIPYKEIVFCYSERYVIIGGIKYRRF